MTDKDEQPKPITYGVAMVGDENGWEGLVMVCEYSVEHPYWTFKGTDGRLLFFSGTVVVWEEK